MMTMMNECECYWQFLPIPISRYSGFNLQTGKRDLLGWDVFSRAFRGHTLYLARTQHTPIVPFGKS